MKLSGQGMPVSDLEGVMPAVGITLPSGASLQSGGLAANLTINGPADKLVIAGPVNLSNGKLAGFNLKSEARRALLLHGFGSGQQRTGHRYSNAQRQYARGPEWNSTLRI